MILLCVSCNKEYSSVSSLLAPETNHLLLFHNHVGALPLAAIYGGIGGGVALVIIVILILLCCCVITTKCVPRKREIATGNNIFLLCNVALQYKSNS